MDCFFFITILTDCMEDHKVLYSIKISTYYFLPANINNIILNKRNDMCVDIVIYSFKRHCAKL